MNCVDYAINKVLNGSDIPEYLLELAFSNPNGNLTGNWYNQYAQTTVQQGIREKIIHAIILPRCNVQGGVTELIDLTGSRIEHLGQGMELVNVPDFLTGGRKIISVVEVYQGAMNSSSGIMSVLGNADSCGVGTVNDALNSMINGMLPNREIPQTFTNITLVGNNSFVIHGAPSGVFSLTGKLILSYDDGLSTIHQRAYDVFADLVILMTKNYIWKTVRYKVDEGVARSGVQVDIIRDDIAEYRDSLNQYEELFKTRWIKLMTYSDPDRRYNAIRNAVPSRI